MSTNARRAIATLAAVPLAALLAGCSLNTVVWGPEGARVIETSERFIRAAAAGDADSFVCAGQHPDLREPGDWVGVDAEEPEKFDADRWPALAALGPAWTINLSAGGRASSPGDQQPGDLVFGRTADGLCVLAVAWMTVGSVS
ncbi:MAG: hypothetical protein J0I44_06630 [Microbacterium sp.]|uniref:hypothetical protein n=1 Tax=Microbacterium sp. TaxID=51671 RepID=UPI001AD3434B|nr:hypothetical protein [Microbacterium sp.]MBN9155650.1 hypothetical protein [Microbacterium sp.]MBN9173141.1 hypothetical protein [Microbacterium sp.]MBN9188154.1 hypothetical protein [Microbacterium sp.]MBN9195731.1 hypothetical protein [Microbacterium sp.]